MGSLFKKNDPYEESMKTLPFFTPICFRGPKTTSEAFHEEVDGYFHLFGAKAAVIPFRTEKGREGAWMTDMGASHWIKTELKVISYFTPVVLFFLAAKALFRWYRPVDVLTTVEEVLERGVGELSDEDCRPIRWALQLRSREHMVGDPRFSYPYSELRMEADLSCFELSDTHMYTITDKSGQVADKQLKSCFDDLLNLQKATLSPDVHGLVVVLPAKKIIVQEEGVAHEVLVQRLPPGYTYGQKTMVRQQLEMHFEHTYRESGEEMLETVKAMTVTIAKSGWSNIGSTTAPLLHEETQGPRRVGVLAPRIELASRGILGVGEVGIYTAPGLLNTLPPNQVLRKAVIQTAHEQGILSQTEGLVAERIPEEQPEDIELIEMWRKEGILKDPTRPLHFDIPSFITKQKEHEKDLDESAWRSALDQIIPYINQHMKRSSEGWMSVFERRSFDLSQLQHDKKLNQHFVENILRALRDKGYVQSTRRSWVAVA